MRPESAARIAKWQRILDKRDPGPNARTVEERLIYCLCGLVLGHNFGESTEAYFERRGLTEFDAWAKQTLKERKQL